MHIAMAMPHSIILGSILVLSVLAPSASPADILVGGETAYTIQKGDSLILIGSKLGVNWQAIARENQVELDKPLKIGRILKVNTRKIVPRITESGIIVNIPDRMLYHFREGKLTSAFPVGLGRPDWETPTGAFTIRGRERNPTWHVPASIREEMEAKGESVVTIVPPGPDNPLGRYALQTSMPGVLLHETIWPTSVYHFRSHACIRIMADHMEKLFQSVRVGTQGEIIYEPVKVALTNDGRVLLEVHRDIYKKFSSLDSEVRKLLDKRELSGRVNWEKINKVLQEKPDIAEDVTS
jgi:L,D-transpeptidase ErfK/SrfK